MPVNEWLQVDVNGARSKVRGLSDQGVTRPEGDLPIMRERERDMDGWMDGWIKV